MWKLSSFVLVLAVILTFATGLLPVNDYDFFWHLKTGEWIWHNKSLPDKDPFSFTALRSDNYDSHRPQIILKSYWLSQLFFYALYSLSGFNGIIVFRSFVFCIILVFLWHTMGKEGIDYRLRAALLILYIFIIREYQKERPQLFSFLFAPIVLHLLNGIKNSSLTGLKNLNNFLRLTGLPLVMFIWANMHGGFLVGIAFIIAYLTAEWLIFLGKTKKSPPLRFTCAAAIAIAAVFINPNSYHTITSFFMFYQSMLPDVTLEFLSPLKIFDRLGSNWYSYWFLLILALSVFIFRFGKFNITEKFVLAGTAVASLSSLRYVLFFFIAAIPIIARHINPFITHFFQNAASSLKSRSMNAMLLAVFFILIYCSPLKSMPLKEDIQQDMFPVEAAYFLDNNDLPELMFNDVTWGGYLIWRLYPKYKVFIDSRTLNIDIFRQYYSVLDASRKVYAGLPEWKGILNTYSVNIILTPLTDRYSGEVLPLIAELIHDDEWALIYLDSKTSIFLRKTRETTGFIKNHYFDKEMLWREIIIGRR